MQSVREKVGLDILGGTIALLGIAAIMMAAGWVTPARAADKGKPTIVDEFTEPTAAKPRWTGPWIGAHLGYSKLRVDENEGGFFGDGFSSFSQKEVTYGGGVGYDVRVPGSMLVLGVMADVDFANTDTVDWIAFVGARGGILVSPSALVYALGGYTWSEGGSDADVLDKGLTVGAGVEAYIFKHVSVKLEYRYIDLGDERFNAGGGGIFALPTSVEGDVQTIRLGVNYRF